MQVPTPKQLKVTLGIEQVSLMDTALTFTIQKTNKQQRKTRGKNKRKKSKTSEKRAIF
jgi:hypothetical protein